MGLAICVFAWYFTKQQQRRKAAFADAAAPPERPLSQKSKGNFSLQLPEPPLVHLDASAKLVPRPAFPDFSEPGNSGSRQSSAQPLALASSGAWGLLTSAAMAAPGPEAPFAFSSEGIATVGSAVGHAVGTASGSASSRSSPGAFDAGFGALDEDDLSAPEAANEGRHKGGSSVTPVLDNGWGSWDGKMGMQYKKARPVSRTAPQLSAPDGPKRGPVGPPRLACVGCLMPPASPRCLVARPPFAGCLPCARAPGAPRARRLAGWAAAPQAAATWCAPNLAHHCSHASHPASRSALPPAGQRCHCSQL